LTSKYRNEDGLNLNFKVYMSPDVNALSTANGSIRVYSGLMDMMRDEELLSVVGHEIGHIKLGHTYSKTRAALVASAARKGVASVNSTVGKLAASEVGGLFQQVITSQYSQAKERASDAYALRFLMKHGYDGQGAVNAMYKLARLESDGAVSGGLKLLSSHPAPRDRAKRLAGMLQEAKSNPESLNQIIAAGQEKKESGAAEMADFGGSDIKVVKGADFVDIDAQAMRSKKPTKTATLKTSASPIQQFRQQTITRNVPSKASEQSIARGYYLQVCAETDEVAAQRKIQMLEAQGFKVTTQNAVVRGVLYKRLLLGPFSSRYQALSERPNINLAGINDGEPFVKRIR
jgi:predicted Zn-dependent protease